MNVSPHELKTIKDFKNLILKKFSLQNKDFQLYLNNGLLLEDESIIILRENDTIRLEYIEPPNLKQNNSSILNMCASNVLNSEISSRNSNEVKFSKKRKRKEITSDIITMESKEAKDSSKKKKHKLSSKTSLAESNAAENPSLIQPVNDYSVIENVSFGVPCNLKNKNHKSHKEKKSKHFHNESAFKSNPCIAVGNEVTLIEDISKISEEDLIPLHCTESKEKASTRCAEIENVVPCNLKNKEHKSHQKQKEGKHYHDKSAFGTNLCNATEKEVILCEEIINISEEDKMSKLAEPKNILETEEQKENNVVSDCCEVVKETHSSSQLYQNNSFTKYNNKNLIEVNQNNQVKFEKQDENNKSGNFNAEYVGCAITNNSELIQGNNCKKKKRYRHRKRKPHLNNSFNNDLIDESHCSDLFMKNLEDGALSNIFDVVKENAVDKNITENSYKYSPSTKTVKTELSEADNIVTNNIYPSSTTTDQKRCTLQVSNQNEVPETLGETLNHGNTFKSCSPLTSSRTPSKFNKQKKEEINSHDESPKSLAISESNCKTINFVTNNSGPPNALKSIKSPTLNLNKEVINWNSKFICSDCPPLDSFPGVGIPIAFKILELDESYSPVISHYREGIVTAVNPQTDELEIKLFQPEVKQGKTGKFENLYLDEFPSCEMTLQWSTLIDPVRLCSC
ncbi:coilin_N domain-containing protein [Trichonephila clavata]|uniref:Coilin_N domain-containing protein n=1 Tax=Trichonephila clavata TaxID=2740835 RepID=A0A8X6FU19_TRICU|nr:coilin_N domain-containing protein [Trichonephila clavata]